MQSTAEINAPSNPGALALLWDSRVDLGHEFGSLAIGDLDYTISAKFLPRYAKPHFGAIFAVSGKNADLAIGQTTYYESVCGPNGCEDKAFSSIAVKLGPSTTVVSPSVLTGSARFLIGQWNHIALTYNRIHGWRLFLNGALVHAIPASGFLPQGQMRVGMISKEDHQSQFYGLVDDLAVFNVEIAPENIGPQLAQVDQLPYGMPGMKYGWSFNNPYWSLTKETTITPIHAGNAQTVTVGNPRKNTDAQYYPAPKSEATYKLPIDFSDEVYVVAADSQAHHSGPWAWSWDFIYAGQRSDPLSERLKFAENPDYVFEFNVINGKGRHITAAAPGHVVHANWQFTEGDGSPVSNSVQVRHAPGEYSSYLHMAKDSFWQLFPWNPGFSLTVPLALFPIVDVHPPEGFPVTEQGRVLGAIGGTGIAACANCYHLHYAVLNKPDLFLFQDRVTRPIEFKNYEYSLDRINWFAVPSGSPARGTYVRHASSNGPES